MGSDGWPIRLCSSGRQRANPPDPREIGTPEAGVGQIPGLLATREDLPGRDGGGTGPQVYADSSRGSGAKAGAAAFAAREPGVVK